MTVSYVSIHKKRSIALAIEERRLWGGRLRLVNRRSGGGLEEGRESLRESPTEMLGTSLVTGALKWREPGGIEEDNNSSRKQIK